MTDANGEAELMRRVRGGDRERFDELVRLHASGLLTFLCRTTGDYHHSEELFQEVFLAVWQKRDTYKHPKPVKPWLYRIALNVTRASWRKARLPMEHPDEISGVAVPASDGPAEQAMGRELISVANQAVLKLPVQQKTVVALRIWNEMTYREIAQVMQLTEATVRSHMHHALRALRRQLAPKLSND